MLTLGIVGYLTSALVRVAGDWAMRAAGAPARDGGLSMSLAAGSPAPRGALRIDNAVKLYDPDGARVLAIDHCSFNVAAGEICMIVGPSGAARPRC